ncbi:MAG TPA: HEAT repeat domain-containing protein, partial [Candidatus Ozemobacteraceae bacterium]|nr:HEAT repeat domain-containing protein [Candidatus Ozemobacteraceae bacterium]
MSLPSSLRARLHSTSPEERRLGLLELAACAPGGTADAHEANRIVQNIAETDPNPEVRASARRILSCISSKMGPSADRAGTASEYFSESSFNTGSPTERLELLLRRNRDKTPLVRDELVLIRETALQNADPRLRSAAVSILGGCTDTPDVLHACVAALADPDARVRANAVEALARLGSEDALRAIAPALTDADHRVQMNAVAALRACGGAPVFRLLRRLSLEGGVSHRRAALHVLSECSFRAALGAIAEVARHENVDQLRQEAKKILESRAATDRYAAELLAGLEPDGSPPPRPPSTGGEQPRTDPATDGTDPLFSIEPSERDTAIEELEYDSSGLTLERVRRAISAERDPFRLSRLLSLAGRHRIAIPPDIIASFLTDTDPRVRAAAVETYATLVPWPAFHDVLARSLRDPHHRVRGTAIMAFMANPELQAAPFLQPLATSESAAARKTVIHILATRPRAEFVPFLEWLLDDPEPEVRNLTFGILRMYETDKIPGAAQLRERIAERAQFRRRKPWVFDNAFDRVFRGLFQPDTPENQAALQADPGSHPAPPRSESPDEVDEVLSPLRESAALLALGEKMAAIGFLPPAT